MLDLDLKTLGFFDFDYAVFADQVESFGDFLADIFVLSTDSCDFNPILLF